MISNIKFENDISYLYNAACLCRDACSGYDGIKQIAPFFASIPYRTNSIQSLEALEASLFESFPELARFGRLRAKKAYQTEFGTITKPSYIGRINNFDQNGLNQVDNIINIAKKEPASGGLCFNIFSPEDLVKRRRPGYVPCLISGSIILHEGELQLNAFFRSQSVVEFSIYDLLFLRGFQSEILRKLIECEALPESTRAGHLNMMMARIFVHRRLLKRRDGSFVRRDDILGKWISAVYGHLMLAQAQ